MRNCFVVFTVLALAGCIATVPQYVSYNCGQHSSWLETAQCHNREYYANAPNIQNDQGYHQIASYRRLLIEKVQSGKMTDAEADYAFQQKIAEENAAIAQARAFQPVIYSAPSQPQADNRPVETNCRPTIGGGFKCTSEPTGPDLSVFHRVR